MKNRNRYISLLLCLSMFFSTIVHSIPTVMAAEKSVEITFEDQKIEDLTIEQSSKEILSVVTSGMEAPSFQWQILLDPHNAIWVDIYDRTELDCEVSYALVKNMLDDALGEIKKSLKDVLIGLTKSALTSDSNYLMYHMLISYIRQYYSIDVKAWKIVKKSETLALKDFRKFAQLHYVYDCITDYWRINRQVSDLQRDLNDAVKRNKYWSAITMAQWEKGIDDLISAQSSVSKTISQKNKLFIDFLMKMKLKEKPQYFVHFMNTDEEDSGFLDFEHIIPKKIIQTHIKDLSVSQQNLFSVSSIGNLCYLTVTDNRAKREKTIYEFKENRPSSSFDMDYLSFIEYPAEDDIVFMKNDN